MTAGCDHKFVDSTSCIKCGWTPPLLNIVRVETEPPDYQADVIMGVGYFRMPSEEAMSDDLQASEAWQNVQASDPWWVLEHQILPNVYGLKAVAIQQLLDARAADAQQIAALRAERDTMDVAHANLCAELAALRAENERLKQPRWECFHCGEVFTTPGGARDHFGATPENTAGCLIDRVALEHGGTPEHGRGLLMELRKAEAQLTALQAEQAQWQQKAAKLSASINEWCNNDAGLTNEEVVEWRDQLAALTAQQEKP